MIRRPMSPLMFLAVITILSAVPRAAAVAQEQDPQPKVELTEKAPDVEYVATPQIVVNLMLELASVKQTDLLYDLGCGDGRIVITAAEKFGCKAMGVDIDPERVRESRENVKAANVEDLVTIEQKDIYELDLSDVDVAMLYLRPELNVRLIPQLKTMKPGSRIVSHDFPMEGVVPEIEVTTVSPNERNFTGKEVHKIYLWTVPLKMEPPKQAATPRTPPAIETSPIKRKFSPFVPFALAAAGIGLVAVGFLLRKITRNV